MDFDHIKEKTIEVSYLVHAGRSLDLIKAEIAKCELVCANCHRMRTLRRRGGPKKYKYKAHKLIYESKNKPCSECGQQFPPECMEFDHIDESTKLFNIGHARLWNDTYLDLIKAEIAKCVIKCVNCHRKRNKEWFQKKNLNAQNVA